MVAPCVDVLEQCITDTLPRSRPWCGRPSWAAGAYRPDTASRGRLQQTLFDRDYWVNVPCTADDDYVLQLAALIKGRLNPSRSIYVEWANETWNSAYPAFQSYAYCDSVAAALNIPAPSPIMRVARYTTIRSLEVFRLFEQVFAEEPGRLVKVLPGWMTQADYTRMVFDTYNDPQYNPHDVVADAFTVTGYCGVSGSTSGATPGIHETVRGYLDSWGRPLWAEHKALCDANGVGLIAYEAGALCSVNPQAFTTHPDMYDLITDLYTTLADYFSVVLPFCHAGTWEFSKPWIGCPEDSANVYRAIRDYTIANPVAVSEGPVFGLVQQHRTPQLPCALAVVPTRATRRTLPPALLSLAGRRVRALSGPSNGAGPQVGAGLYVLQP